MSEQGNPVAVTEGVAHKINPLLLFAVFAIVPLVGLFVLCDHIFFGMGFSRSLPAASDNTGVLNTIFMLPHVVASVFTFADSDYVTAYRTRLALSTVAIIGGMVAVPMWLGYGVFFFGLVVYTAYHQISQQAGIAAIVAKNRAPTHEAWRWMSLVFLLILVFGGALAGNPAIAFFSVEPYRMVFRILFTLLIIVYTVLTIMTARRSRTRVGVFYILASALVIAFNYYLYSLGLFFFILLITRVLHDVTAFIFYAVHDANRNEAHAPSLMAKLSARVPLPQYLLTPALALATSLLLTGLVPQPYLLAITVYLAFFHYYWEGVMWKKDSPHRKYVSVT